jgi:hypothetical protein
VKWGSFQALVGRHRFPFAIGGVIGIALLMTAVSLSLYVTSGTARLDLSRPGYESVRKNIQQSSGESFNPDGPVDKAALDEFDKLFGQRRANLNALGDFEDTSIDDVSLRLAPTP